MLISLWDEQEQNKRPSRFRDECETEGGDKGEAVNMRSVDLKTSKQEAGAYISGLSR